MKFKSLVLMFAAGFVFASCSDNANEPVLPGTGDSTNEASTIKVVVPSSTRTVKVVYPVSEGVDSVFAPITLDAAYSERYGVSAITTGEIKLASPVTTVVDIYDEYNNLVAKNVKVNGVDGDVVSGAVTLLEAAVAPYVTSDANQIFYHSSGVAMFDDSWPLSYTQDEDYNDVIIDYDIETKYVDMSVIPEQAWREQVKVVMHLRAMGGQYPSSAGLYLESLDNKYVADVQATLTLGNHNEEDAAKMGVTYNVDMSGEHPLITFNNLQWLVSEEARTATYTKNGQTWYMNPRDPEKITINNNPLPYTDIAANTFYNVNPGIVNTGGSLLTLTVIFRGIDRNELSAEEGEAQIKHFIDATLEINKQNFFIGCYSGNIKHEFEVHMKGYNPTPYYTNYEADNRLGVEKDPTTTYSAADGSIYGFKVPVDTRHAYEKKPLRAVYPKFSDWFESKGALCPDWYTQPDESDILLCCWW